ncbi:MAG TPA: pseudouridine synthase [Bacteroidales bacterium]|nr:pseudouridine synthase [Bacteroidales bacterium]
MTTNNDESRPKRSYNDANNERHASSNRNYSGDRRIQQDGYQSERPYRQGNPNQRNYQERGYYGNQERRNYNENERGSYGNQDRGRYSSQERRSYGNQDQGRYNHPDRGGYGNQQDRGSYGGNERGAYGNQERRPYGNQQRGSYGNQQRGTYGASNRGSYNDRGDYGNREAGAYEGGPATRKRRPRVGERTQSGQRSQGGGYNRSWGNQPQYPGGRPQQGGPRKKLKKKKPFKQIKYKEDADPNAPIRLNKYLANAGICSRREADEFIQAGVVKVNGEVISELGTKITRADEVLFNNQPVQLESKVYVLLNKPKGFVTTTDDPENRKTVMELVKSAATERIYPVGRLDRATTGVLLLTNDGDLASKLTHPKYEKRKIYQVWLDKPVTMEHMQMIADGIELEDGEIHADAISYVTEEDLTQVGIEIHSGRNRIVRRIFEKLGYRVLKLDRVYFAGLTKKKLSRGKWRYLTEQEVNMLRMGAFD